MKRLIITLAAAALLSGCQSAPQNDDWTTQITSEIALKAIGIFEANPLGEDAEGALSIIVNYAKLSDEVYVLVEPRTTPWLTEDDKKHKHAHTLVGALIAGNMKPQLETGIRQDRPYDGALQVIDTYQQLRELGESERIPCIEVWLELSKAEELRESLGLSNKETNPTSASTATNQSAPLRVTD